ncbi:DUF2894 domain-containing protein [Variovorax sp. YR752]|uniref:DUF2894 domain-containing protein n=1 Tax=Variovorax sp. YR752 TaxID=1884383 RepID=UPI003137830C
MRAEAGLDPIAAVEAGRACGAARVDPVAWCVIEALARRAAAQQGEARRLLVARVERLLDAHAAATPAAAPGDAVPDERMARRAALAGLSELVDRLGRSAAPPGALPPGTPSRAPSSGPLKAVTAYQGTWSRLRAEQRLRQALAQVPAQAGPLNSLHVVHAALRTMHELSPAYLDAFMSHVDTLLWLEQASGGNLAARPAARVESARRPRAPSARKG